MPHPSTGAQTLTDFARQPGCSQGLGVSALPAGTILVIETRHSRYRVLLIDPRTGRALVSGSDWFPEPTEARLEGATTGGSILKAGWICVGLKLEISVGQKRVTTSRVVSCVVLSTPS